MPEKDGIQFVRELKAAGSTARCIMISRCLQGSDWKGLQRGNRFFISKPINIIEVKSVIENVERQIQNERTLSNIRKMFMAEMNEMPKEKQKNDAYVKKLQLILNRIGMSGEKGCDDISKSASIFTPTKSPSLR